MARKRQTYAQRKAAVIRITGDPTMTPDRYAKLRREFQTPRGVRGIPLGPRRPEHITGNEALARWGITRAEFYRMLKADSDYAGQFWGGSLKDAKLWKMLENKHVAPEKKQKIRTSISANLFDEGRARSGITYDSVGYVVTYYHANVDPMTNWTKFRDDGSTESAEWQKLYLTQFAESIERYMDDYFDHAGIMDIDEFEARYGAYGQ